MQTVGKIQAVAPRDDGLRAAAVQIVAGWADEKFEQDASGFWIVKRSGVKALCAKSEFAYDGNTLTKLEVLEPIEGGQLQTVARILTTQDHIRINCDLSIGSDGGLAPPNVDLHVPSFVRDLISASPRWQFSQDGENIISRFIDVGIDDVEIFLSLLRSPLRRLPLIVVSQFEGRTLAGDAHQRISADLCGLAHTCRLTEQASWEITGRLGKEWSTYNGAVRIFWPLRANSENPRSHPLWTYDALSRHGENEREIRDWLRYQLRGRLLDASTFLADDPSFAAFDRGLAQTRRDEARGVAKEDYDAAQEIRTLRAELDAKDLLIATLQSNVEALTIALRSQPGFEPDAARPDGSPPTTVAEALATARRLYGGRLAFGDDVESQIGGLNPGAGPPEKMLRYFKVLADLSSALETGSLGRSVPIWLRDAGIEASGESETMKKSKDARRERTFSFDGEEIYCEFHAKPSDGVSPDLCARIYFAVAAAAPHVRIGYVGRHFD